MAQRGIRLLHAGHFRCIIKGMSETLAPGFIVAVPHLMDPNFQHSVVLLFEQNEEGALGVVINHESPLRLRELCSDHNIIYIGDPEKRVRKGGPVQPEQGPPRGGPFLMPRLRRVADRSRL